MTGNVVGRQAELPVVLRSPSGGPDLSISFVVDTGFAGFLTLPLAAVQALNLTIQGNISANLADASTVAVGVYRAIIVWESQERTVDVLAMGRRPLLGTALLNGHALGIQFQEGGLVAVTTL